MRNGAGRSMPTRTLCSRFTERVRSKIRGLPLPGEVPELPDGLGRHEGGSEETEGQELGDPRGVDGVGLSSRHVLDVGGVDE